MRNHIFTAIVMTAIFAFFPAPSHSAEESQTQSSTHISRYSADANGNMSIFHGSARKTVTLKKMATLCGKNTSRKNWLLTGITKPILAEDSETLGWLAEYNGCNASYSCPYALLIYRQGKLASCLVGERSIFDWAFFNKGKHAAIRMEFPHGLPLPGYALYNVKSGKLLERYDENGINNRSAYKPNWAMQIARKDQE